MVALEISRPLALGNTSRALSGRRFAAVSTSSAADDRGTRWGRAFLARSAGTVHSAAFLSISFQRAPRTSLLRPAVRARNPKASLLPI